MTKEKKELASLEKQAAKLDKRTGKYKNLLLQIEEAKENAGIPSIVSLKGSPKIKKSNKKVYSIPEFKQMFADLMEYGRQMAWDAQSQRPNSVDALAKSMVNNKVVKKSMTFAWDTVVSKL